MAETYSVKAVLSAADKGFTSAIKGAGSAVDTLGSKLKSGLGFGILTGIGQKAFDSISSGIGGLISDMNEASAAWKTFQGNMSMNGHSAKEIKKTKSVLQDYATKTIYSASDMATTFAQLDAVGIKSAQDLVTGFGGLAAAAENPQQAMKTLSQQATQMAAKPMVQWQDFKLMLEQTPAGIAAIAKAMGMSTAELVKQVQAGTVKTEDFFNAIKEVGNNDDFSKLATQYKTVGQAMDGLKETLSNKLAPAFNAVSDIGIQAISNITDALDGIDGDAIAGKIKDLVATVKPYWTIIKTDAGIVKDAFEEAFSAIGKALGKLNGSFGSDENVSGFSKTLGTVTQAVTKFAGLLEEHADTIAKVIKAVTDHLPQLLGAFLALKGAQKAVGGIQRVSTALTTLKSLFGKKGLGSAGKTASRRGGAITKLFTGIAKVVKAAGTAVSTAAKGIGTAISGVLRSAGTALPKILKGIATALNTLKPRGMLAFVVVVGTLTAALSILSVVAGEPLRQLVESLGNAFATIAGGVGQAFATIIEAIGTALGTVIEALSTIAPVLPEIITAMGAAGAAIGGAIAKIVEAATPLVETITNAFVKTVGIVADAVVRIVEVLAPYIPSIQIMVTATASAIEAICAAFISLVEQIKPIIDSVKDLVKQVGDTISEVAETVADSVTQIVESVGSTLCECLDTAASSIETTLGAIGGLFEDLSESVATVIDSISSGISDVLDSVAGVIESIGNSARNAGEGFQLFADGVSTIVGLPLVDTAASLAAVATGIGEIALAGSGMGEVGEGMRGVATALQMILQGQGAIAQLVTISQMAPVAASNLNAMAAALGNFGPAAAGTAAAAAAILVLVSAASRAGGASLAMAGGLRASGAAARGLSGGLTASASGLRVVASAGNSAVKSVKGIQDAAKGTASALLPIGAAAKSAASALIKSLTSAAAAAKAAGLAIGKGVSQSIQRGFAPLPKLAQSAMNSVANSVQSGGTKAATSAQRAASAIVKAFQQAVPRATAAGGYIGKGLANGMASTLSRVRSVAAQLAAAADAAIRAKAKIASPSKVAHKSGAFIGTGLANGMLSKVNAVTAAAKKLAASALKQLRAKASSSGGNYKSLGEKLSKGYKTSLTKSLNKALKAAKKLIQKRTGKALTGKLYTALSKAMKSGASKAISTAQKAITRVSTAAQEKYDAAIQRRDSFYEKLADMGDIYTVDSYGYLSLKDFDAGTKQINALGKNLNKLKSKLPQGLLNEIADMETANGLAYTNRLLKMSAEELKAYGNSYTRYVGAAEKTSSAFCKSQLSAIRKEFNSSVTRELKSLNARLTAVGKDAMAGFVKGMNSVTKKLKGSSKRLALSVVSVFRKYLKIHSPSRVFAQLGRYVGQGFADGMESTGRMIQRVAAEIISIPAAAPVPVLAGGGKLPADCDYYDSGEYTVIVPVELDGREVARVTAPYTQKELNKLQTRDNRKRGRTGR